MGFLGAHVSIAGGVSNSVSRALSIGCETFQIFTRNQRQWSSPPLEEKDIAEFRRLLEESGLGPVVAHDSYLINLGSPDEGVFERSCRALSDELSRCSGLGIGYLVAHPGSHLGTGEEKGMERIASGIDLAWSYFGEGEHDVGEKEIKILLETTAGQGTNLGFTFEQLASIMERSAHTDHLGVCIDTCHIFAAGYDLRTKEDYMDTMDIFDSILSLDRLGAFHLNDSRKNLGSRVDRHTNIGKGHIGIEGFRSIVNDGRLRDIPMILETPGGAESYMRDLELLRSLLR